MSQKRMDQLIGAGIGFIGFGLIWFVAGFWTMLGLWVVLWGNNIARSAGR